MPFGAGIVSGLYLSPSPKLIISSGIILAATFLFSLFYNRRESNVIYGLALTGSLILCGLLIYTAERGKISILQPSQSTYTGTVADYPAEKTNSFLINLKLKTCSSIHGSRHVNGSMLLYHRKDSPARKFIPGDIITVRCKPLEISERANPYEFDYRFYMENQGIKYYAYTDSQNIVGYSKPPHRHLIYNALIFREKIIRMYEERGITGERLALVAAITLGQKNMLDPGQKNYFIRAGVMHIMAVSGLHTVILSLFIFHVLFFMKGRFNILRILITLLLLWAFAFVTGLTPSVLRATMMFTFLQAGSLLKRPPNGINSVLASAFVLMIIRPSVIFDAGFLLSYSAVIYIIAFYRDLYQTITFRKSFVDKIWQSAAVTIVAQAGTLPLTISLFNRFPVYFILTNIIIVPLSSLLVIIGCIIPLLYPLKFFSHMLAVILGSLTGLTEFLTKLASSLPLASIENIGMTTYECILFTSVVFLLSCYFMNRKTFPLIYPLLSLLIFLGTGTVRELSTRTSNEIIVYSTPGSSTVGIRTGRILNIYSDTLAVCAEVKRHAATLGLKVNMNRINGNTTRLVAGRKRILIANSLYHKAINTFHPDLIILTGQKPDMNAEVADKLPAGTEIILAAGFAGINRRQGFRPETSYPVYTVRTSGAYFRKI